MRYFSILALTLGLFLPANAVVSVYSGTSKVNFSSDSSGFPPWPVLEVFDNSNVDTARMALRGSSELRWPYCYKDSLGVTRKDSGACLVKLLVSGYDPTYNPSADVHWFLANGFKLTAPVAFGPPEIVRRVDSLFAGGGGSGGGSGTGPWSDSILFLRASDSTPLGAGLKAWLGPNGGGSSLSAETDANGWAVFSVDTDTFLVLSWLVGYQQDIVPDTNAVPGVATIDTVFMNATVPAGAPAPGLTPVTFNLFRGNGDSLKSATLYYKLDIGSAITAYHVNGVQLIDPGKWFDASTTANGQVTVYVIPNDSILVDGNQSGKTRWIFRATSPDTGEQLLGKDGVKVLVPFSLSALVWPRDF